jgi:diguanylate cyclase (GGDEF)-like protein/PAS domain S-box-containing protein
MKAQGRSTRSGRGATTPGARRAVGSRDGMYAKPVPARDAQALNEHLQAIYQAVPDMIIIHRADGSVLDVNDNMLRGFGCTREQALSLPLLRFAGRDGTVDKTMDRLYRCLIGEIQDFEWTARRIDGEEFLAEVRLRRLGDGTGEAAIVAVVRDISARKEAEHQLAQARDRLSQMAFYDALTGLPNRTLMQDRLGQALLEAEINKRLVAVLFLDLDRFKTVNDTLGHAAGDTLLKGVAERLLANVRRGDTVARLAGDEFMIVLTSVAQRDDVLPVARKLLESFNDPFVVDGHRLFVTPSMGITIYPDDDRQIEGLLKNADTAMYHAKEQGRNNFQLFVPEMHTQSMRRLTLGSSLREALERNELLLHYQPQLSLCSGRVVGVEALLRWHHPELGLIAPADFIPLAEETGLIVPIGEWVIRTACAQALAWQKAGVPPLRVAVNLSARQFWRGDMAQVVQRALAETPLDPQWLELELTESMIVQYVEQAIGILREIKAMGVGVSVDDFGTGYSSLAYLRRLPIDALKIDRSFVDGVTDHSDDAAITRTIIAMAKSLKLRVVAEGVETDGQLAFLREHGCDEAQGYLLGRPQPVAEVEAQLSCPTPRVMARV